jgi:hypothetical protein
MLRYPMIESSLGAIRIDRSAQVVWACHSELSRGEYSSYRV